MIIKKKNSGWKAFMAWNFLKFDMRQHLLSLVVGLSVSE